MPIALTLASVPISIDESYPLLREGIVFRTQNDQWLGEIQLTETISIEDLDLLIEKGSLSQDFRKSKGGFNDGEVI